MTLLEIDSKTLNGHTDTAPSTHGKKTKKRKIQKGYQEENYSRQKFSVKRIDPLTNNQKAAFSAWNNGQNLLLHGLAGTGKSFISLYLALREISQNNSHYKKIIIVRSAVPTRDMGFLPGNMKDKAKAYELPYMNICTELFERGDAYELLKSKKSIDFMTTSFIRGNTFHDSIVIVDEVNNMTFHELDSIITRLGDNCRMMMCGDYRQSDLKPNEKKDLLTFINVIDRIKGFTHIEFEIDDIVRSGLVKEYIIAKHSFGLT